MSSSCFESEGSYSGRRSYIQVWYGMVWYGMVWYGMVWYGMVWYGMVWYGMVWCALRAYITIKGFYGTPKYKIFELFKFIDMNIII